MCALYYKGFFLIHIYYARIKYDWRHWNRLKKLYLIIFLLVLLIEQWQVFLVNEL